MKQFMDQNSYAVTSAVFLALALVGILRLGWGQFALAYLVLLYCVVIIGIRLDDISRQVQDLTAVQTALLKESGNPGTYTQAVTEIKQLNIQLGEIKDLLARQSPSPGPKGPGVEGGAPLLDNSIKRQV